MLKTSKLSSLVLALALVLSTVISVTGCAGEETPPTLTPPSTPTPTGGLSVGATFTLGPAKVSVTRVAYSDLSPGLEKPPQPGNKFVIVDLLVHEIQPGGKLDSSLMLLEFSSGKQYGPPKIYGEGEDPKFGKYKSEAGSRSLYNPTESATVNPPSEFKLFFEVAQSEDLGKARLLYH